MYGMHMGFGWIVWILFLGVVLYLFFQFFSNEKPNSSKTPKEILDERLARGEITPKEYDELLDKLQGAHNDKSHHTP